MNEEWLGHLEALHTKLEFVKGSPTVQVTPSWRECVFCTGRLSEACYSNSAMFSAYPDQDMLPRDYYLQMRSSTPGTIICICRECAWRPGSSVPKGGCGGAAAVSGTC